MIRIDLGPEVDGPLPTSGKRHGVFRYSCAAYGAMEGFSRQPLLDACRQLKSLYGLNTERAGLFREGSDVAGISCSVDVGAATTVGDRAGSGIRFEKYVDLAKVYERDAARSDTHAQ